MKYTIAIAGTTKRTRQCAQTLLDSDSFTISWVLTPIAKPVGRKQIVTPNPMEEFAKDNNFITIFVEKKIKKDVKNQINKLEKPDFLLVVDFGYIVPTWLLETPKISPLNIHPSALPSWRGSSPGQFSILFNDKKSAVTLMVMNKKLDHGPIIHQDFFNINQNWTQKEYYQHAFDLMCNDLDKKIVKYAQNQKIAKSQPEDSPTLIAKTITKQEAFVPWKHILMATKGLCPTNLSGLSELLQNAYKSNQQFTLTLERASKAFNPWPNLWTIVKTNKGEKRMKILETEIGEFNNNSKEKQLILKTVQIEGKNPTPWNDVKNSVID